MCRWRFWRWRLFSANRAKLLRTIHDFPKKTVTFLIWRPCIGEQ
jgi:hypothetical protein